MPPTSTAKPVDVVQPQPDPVSLGFTINILRLYYYYYGPVPVCTVPAIYFVPLFLLHSETIVSTLVRGQVFAAGCVTHRYRRGCHLYAYVSAKYAF